MDTTVPQGMGEPPPPLCSRCGAVLSSMVEGMCPGCLMDTALGPPPPFPEDSFGDYALVQELAQGGMGVVYRARQHSLERLVALKMLTGGALASDAEMHRIHAEAKIAASLKHPNIVPIYEVGVYEEIPYFTMPLMEGGSLAGQMPRLRGRFREAARLLETISRAVHHGHQRGILHRDLKPANVLLDAAGVPYVADFGLAKALDSEALVTQTGSVEGTLSYMALEQAQPRGLPLTVAVDVYSLGVILYELLTGRLPFEADSFDTLLERLREGRPRSPRAIDPRIPRSLEAICLKCLEQEPARRYGSAAELAEELRRAMENKPVLAMPAGPLKHAWMWCLRHPLGAGVLAALFWTLLVAAVGFGQTTRKQEEVLRKVVRETNIFNAPLIARAVLHNLEKVGVVVKEMATRPELASAIQALPPEFTSASQEHDEERARAILQRHGKALEEFCEKRFAEHSQEARDTTTASGRGPLFVRVFIEDTNGTTLARWPQPEMPDTEFLGKGYAWRDYHKGAAIHGKARERDAKAYISQAYVSESHQRLTFAISVPIFSPEGDWLGILVTAVASNSTLGELPLRDSDHTVSLVSLVDTMRDGPPPYRYAFVVLDGLVPGTVQHFDDWGQLEQAFMPAPPLEPGQPHPLPLGGRELKNYMDPVEHKLMLATFARVGDTSFVVITATREEVVVEARENLARHIALWSLPFVGIGLVCLVFWEVRSRHGGQRSAWN